MRALGTHRIRNCILTGAQRVTFHAAAEELWLQAIPGTLSHIHLPFSAALPLIFSCLTLVHRNPLSKYLWKLTQPESNTLFSLKRIHTKNLGSSHSSQPLQILWKLKAFKPRFLTKRTVPCKVLKWSDCYLTCPCLLCIYCQSLTTRGRLTLRFLVWLVL